MKTVFRSCIAALFVTLFAAGSPNVYAQQWVTTFYEPAAPRVQMTVADIPWDHYTHINHFAVSTTGNGDIIRYYLTQENIDAFIKSKPAGKKALLSIIDNYEDFSLFPKSASPANIDKFVTSIVDFVVANGYDGVDLDWEKNVDSKQFAELVRKLRSSPKMEGKLINMNVNPVHAAAVAETQSLIDQVNIMCYDFDWDSTVAWHNGALYQRGNPNAFTCDWKIGYFLNAGVARSKLGLGMPFYGRKWYGATKPFDPSPFDWRNTLYYRDIISDAARWKEKYQAYDPVYGGDYLSIPDTSPTEFISYTGVRFIKDAMSYVKSEGFGGVMTYNTEYEFLKNEVGNARYPLSTAILNELRVSAPTGLSATSAADKVDLRWTPPFAATAYKVFRRTNGGPAQAMATVNSTTYTDTAVSLGLEYDYFVTAVNASGEEGGSSDRVSVQMPPPSRAPAPIVILPPPPPPEVSVRLDQNDARILYIGTWYSEISPLYTESVAARSISSSARASFSFNGTAVRVIGYRDASSGLARVYLDGVLRGEIDTYAPSTERNAVLYSASNLVNGAHTLEVEVLGRRRTGANGSWIWIDAFEYSTPATNQTAATPPAAVQDSGYTRAAASASNGLQVGYARLRSGNLGYALLDRIENNITVGQSAIPASQLRENGRMFVEMDGNTATGLAIVNPNAQANTVEFFFTDDTGADFGRGTFMMSAHGQQAAFLNEAPFNCGRTPCRGTFTFVSSLPVVATAIHSFRNERLEFVFSTMPVGELTPAHNDAMIIPHVAYGQGWTTEVVLVNPTGDRLSGSAVLSTDVAYRYSIPPRASQTIKLAGATQSVSTGHVRILPDASSNAPYSFALLSYKSGGVTTTKASTPSLRPGSTFEIDVAREGLSTRTGIALVNTSDETVTVTLDLKSVVPAPNGWRTTRVLQPNSHAALYLDEMPGFETLPSSLNGILRIESSRPDAIAALGLRTRDDGSGRLLLTNTVTRDERQRNSHSDVIIPHFASGSGYRTEFVTIGGLDAQTPIALFDHRGQPVPLGQ